jgi:hypothetical protein
MLVSCSSKPEFDAAPWAVAFRSRTGFFALVSQEIAERGKLTSIAAILPALRLGLGVQDTGHDPIVLVSRAGA